LIKIDTALQSCSELIVLIVSGHDFCKLWINYEIGFARGRGLKPKIFVFGGINFSKARYPIVGIHWIDTGDTNRWKRELEKWGSRSIRKPKMSWQRFIIKINSILSSTQKTPDLLAQTMAERMMTILI